MPNTPNYQIDYDDERFKEVETERDNKINEMNSAYDQMIGGVDEHINNQINEVKDWQDKQQQIQQENTDFLIEQTNQQKDQAHKDYVKEQSGSYVDWQKQKDAHGVNAEQMAMQGMVGSGYSESSQVAMYTAYQNRVAVARDSYNRAVLNYDNAIKEAILQNNSKLAEIAHLSLQQQLELALEGFQYKNTLLLEKMNKQQELNNTYYSRYQDVIAQMNQENALAEQIRQHNEEMAFKKKQMEEEIRQFNEEIARLKKKDEEEYKLEIQKLELQKAQLEEEKRQFDKKNSSKTSGYISSLPIIEDKNGNLPLANGGTISAHGGQGSSGANASAGKGKPASAVKYSVGSGGAFGNSKATMKKSDYYFSNGYQPRYIDNKKLVKTGDTVASLSADVIKQLGVPTSQNIWKAGGRAYVWNGKTREYMCIGSA